MLYALSRPRLARDCLGGEHPRWWSRSAREGVQRAPARFGGSSRWQRSAGWSPSQPPRCSAPGQERPRDRGRGVGGRADPRADRRLVPLVVLASLDGGRTRSPSGCSPARRGRGWYADRHVYSWDIRSTGRRGRPFGLTVALVVGLRFGWLTGLLAAILLTAAAVVHARCPRRPSPPHRIRTAGRPARGN